MSTILRARASLTMICSNCGAAISPGDGFCGECGQPLAASSPAQPPAQPPVLPAASPPPRAAAAARKRPLFVLLAALGTGLLLCLCVAALLLFRSRPGPAPTTPPAQGEPTPGALLFFDGFDDERGGWDAYVEDDTEAGYADQEYRLGVYRANYVVWANPSTGTDLSNFSVEADVRQVEGPLDNNYGLIVRYQSDDRNFYWFEISSDGYYSVDLLRADQWVTLVDWQASDAVNQGLGATNHLMVVCDDSRFTFYVNGTLLTTVIDHAFSEGNIGVAAGVFDQAGAVFHFDNVRVYALEP